MRRTVLSCSRAAHCPARLPAPSAAAARFEPNGSKPSYAKARQCGFRPLPSIPDFAEYVGVYPRGSAVSKRHRPRMHSPLSIRKREVGKTKLGETHARSIFETDPVVTDVTDTIQARRYHGGSTPAQEPPAIHELIQINRCNSIGYMIIYNKQFDVT